MQDAGVHGARNPRHGVTAIPDEQDHPRVLTRMDMHCHSKASSKPVFKMFAVIDAPECYSEPEAVYDQAKARGMDLVTITDHDSIAGAIELEDRGFQDFVIGEEVTVHFPEDRCMLHVLVWGHTPSQHEEINALGLRDDVYAFSQWLVERNLPHSFAHPLYVQNGKLTSWHLERASLLFKGWETLNGAHSHLHRKVVERYLEALTPARVNELSRRHGISPAWSRVWHKGITGGSDDHGRMNIGQTWTGVEREGDEKIEDPREFLRRVMAGRSSVAGQPGHSSLLAHQLTTVAVNYYGDKLHEHVSTRGKYIASKLTRFAGVAVDRPGKVRLALHEMKRRILAGGRKRKSLPIVKALKQSIGPVLEKYPDLRERLNPETWDAGAAVANHDRMAEFTNELSTALGAAMASGAVQSIRERDKLQIVDHLLSYGIVHLAQLPYLFSMFYQNKERNMLEKLEHDTVEPGTGVSVLERPMKVSLFTDTLGDVNGVCRFIQNVADQANKTGRDLQVVTSTQFDVPRWPNIRNFDPVFATRMPKYEQLELVLPPLMKILRDVDKHQPDVIHVSTPGPVGLIGFLAAKMLRVPVLGVYHTDFPAYVDRLFDDHAFTYFASSYMRFFYQPFSAIFTRSQDYVESLVELGMPRDRMVRLMPGIETAQFNTGFRDEQVWQDLERDGHAGISRDAVKVLYVGRVSVEKNMPLLTRVWKQVQAKCMEAGHEAQLIIVGDGPYRPLMEKELSGAKAHFLGFRHGKELSTIYASSSMFAFPSTTDTLGQVVMESQSSGLPVIVTDEGGPKEVVDHARTGFVLPADDASLWVRTLVNLIGDHGKRRAMGAAAAEAMQKFDIANSFEHFWEVHTEAWHGHLRKLGIEQRDGDARPDSGPQDSQAGPEVVAGRIGSILDLERAPNGSA
ncbi:MAG: glycosyltransferase [Planctomycetota bacterium]